MKLDKQGSRIKFQTYNVYLIAADISEDSVRVCENDRYHSNKMIMRSTGRPPFEAEFIVADCCEVRIHVHVHSHARAHMPHAHGIWLCGMHRYVA